MGKLYDSITPELQRWIGAQALYFVSTAPLSAAGHVNCSPKGLDSFRLLGPRSVAYLDLTGSGAETIAHLRENGRIVFMFCALNGPPKIVRLHGRGEVVTQASHPTRWQELMAHFAPQPGVRSIITADITRISDSCGYGVPKYEFVGDRDAIQRWVDTRGVAALPAYRQEKNLKSLDGLPSLKLEEP